MPKKRILTVGVPLASDEVTQATFESKVSLLDWDIILFKPVIDDLTYATNRYQGRPSLNDYDSLVLKEACEHWRREIKQAVENGKTVIVFLPAVKEVYVDTGRREYSGTGRNKATTKIVDLCSNYTAIPFDFAPINTAGSEIKLAPGGEVLREYWEEFGSVSRYEVLLVPKTPGICLTTKSGDKPVGAISRHPSSSGALVVLPNIDFSPDEFYNQTDDDAENDEDDDDDIWSPEAKQFASRITRVVIALDGALRASTELTPQPHWATDPLFVLAKEQVLRSELLEAERQLEAAQKSKEQIQERLRDAGKLRALLYEKGKPLEKAIIDALQLLRFEAQPFREGNSEFDVVFSCSEGRLVGEAEGKDTKAINIDKLRQLTMNIQEDLAREEVHSPAKGVLFGNGYRLLAPSVREPQFTEKCITSAESMNTALIATSDLYRSVQHLADAHDEDYARLCREVILTSVGLVNLPAPPAAAEQATHEAVTEEALENDPS
jgi:hypothetical protein